MDKNVSKLLTAKDASEFSPERKQALLLCCIGTEAQRIYYSIPETTPPTGTDVFSHTLTVLSKQFEPAQKPVIARIKFKQREQLAGESIKSYYRAPRELAEPCKYGANESEMIRDQIIHKCNNERLQDRLLFETKDITLDLVLKHAEQIEQATEDIKTLRDSIKKSESTVNYVKGMSKSKGYRNVKGQFKEMKDIEKKKKCYRCGSFKHLANSSECKAKGITCNKCKKVGHFAKHCRSTEKVKYINTNNSSDFEESVDQNDFLSDDVIVCTTMEKISKNAWYCDIQINGVKFKLLVDTGSPKTLLNSGDYDKLGKLPLLPPQTHLNSYSSEKIPVLGCFYGFVKCGQAESKILIHVVEKGLSLIGMDLIVALKINFDEFQQNMTQEVDLEDSNLPLELKEFSDLFTSELGCVKNFEYKPKVKSDITPVQAKLRRLPFSVHDKVSEELNRLEAADVIERIDSSEWVSPLVVVWKKSGKIRLCVDLRKVNKALVVDKFPLPNIDEILGELHGAKYFARLDLASAYHQLPLSAESRDLTAFITHDGLFRFKRVCFGIASAPSAFQKMMSASLRGLKGIQFYLDDIIVFGKTKEEYLKNLRAVLERIRQCGLKLNEKCSFNMTNIEFLGHMITLEGLKPLPKQTEAITKAPAPHDSMSLRSFLGLVGFYSKFIPDYSTVVEPLRALLRGSSEFKWTDEAQKSFEQVKMLIGNHLTLSLFDPTLDTIVTTDASGYGISGILSQVKDGKEHIVYCASRTLTETERKYSVGEREALACVWSCERWYTYLWARPFELRTDHSALTTLLSSKELAVNQFA